MKKPISLLLVFFPTLCLALQPPKTNEYFLSMVLIIEAIIFFFVSSLIQAYLLKKRVIKILLINIVSFILGCTVLNILMNLLGFNDDDVLSTLFSLATAIIAGSILIYYLLGKENNFLKIICVFISANLISIGLIYLSSGLVYKSVHYIYYNFLYKLFPSLPSY